MLRHRDLLFRGDQKQIKRSRVPILAGAEDFFLIEVLKLAYCWIRRSGTKLSMPERCWWVQYILLSKQQTIEFPLGSYRDDAVILATIKNDL